MNGIKTKLCFFFLLLPFFAFAQFTPIPGFEETDPFDEALIDGVAEFKGTYYLTDQFNYGTSYWTSTDGVNFIEQSPSEEIPFWPTVHPVSDGLAFYQLDYLVTTSDGETFHYTEFDDRDSFETESIWRVAHLGGGVWIASMTGKIKDSHLWRSTNDGATWAPLTTFPEEIPEEGYGWVDVTGKDGVAFIFNSAMGSFWRSVDNGVSWQEATLPFTPYGTLHYEDGHIWIGEDTGKVWRTDDMGATWQETPLDLSYTPDGGLPGSYKLIEVAPDGEYFAHAGQDKIFRSEDGRNWTLYVDSASYGFIEVMEGKFWVVNDNAYLSLNESFSTLYVADLNAKIFSIGPFTGLQDAGNGDARSDWFDWFNVSAYPWIYHYTFGYQYLMGPDENIFYGYDPDFGTYYTSAALYPVLYAFGPEIWLYADRNSTQPAGFWTLPDGDYLTEPEVGGAFPFAFTEMFGRSYTIKDTIGTHSITFNNQDGPVDDGADLLLVIDGTQYTFSEVSLAYTDLVTGPQIVVQAVAIVGDTALGSTAQFTLRPDSQTTGSVQWAGYSIFGGTGVTIGGEGVTGTYEPAP